MKAANGGEAYATCLPEAPFLQTAARRLAVGWAAAAAKAKTEGGSLIRWRALRIPTPPVEYPSG